MRAKHAQCHGRGQMRVLGDAYFEGLATLGLIWPPSHRLAFCQPFQGTSGTCPTVYQQKCKDTVCVPFDATRAVVSFVGSNGLEGGNGHVS